MGKAPAAHSMAQIFHVGQWPAPSDTIALVHVRTCGMPICRPVDLSMRPAFLFCSLSIVSKSRDLQNEIVFDRFIQHSSIEEMKGLPVDGSVLNVNSPNLHIQIHKEKLNEIYRSIGHCGEMQKPVSFFLPGEGRRHTGKRFFQATYYNSLCARMSRASCMFIISMELFVGRRLMNTFNARSQRWHRSTSADGCQPNANSISEWIIIIMQFRKGNWHRYPSLVGVRCVTAICAFDEPKIGETIPKINIAFDAIQHSWHFTRITYLTVAAATAPLVDRTTNEHVCIWLLAHCVRAKKWIWISRDMGQCSCAARFVSLASYAGPCVAHHIN